MAPARPMASCLLAGFSTTVVVFGVAIVAFVFLLVLLNGVSEQKAAPLLYGYWVAVFLANAALVALALHLVLRRHGGVLASKLLVSAQALGFSLLPFAVFAAILVTRALRARG